MATAVAAAPTPSPSPAPPADACAANGHTGLLATINRPTTGFSACAVKPHEFLGEVGYANQSGGDGAVQYQQGFLRYGLEQGLEVDVIGPAYEIQRPGTAGFVDPGVGAKWEFAQGSGGTAAIDFLYTAPLGAAAFTTGTPTQTLNIDYSTSVSSRFGIGTTVGVEHTQGFTTLLPSAVVTDQYNSRTQLYGEAYAQTKTADGGSLFGLDGGVQHLLTPQLEIDVEAGRTVTNLSRNHYYGFGFGVRL
jgi:Putative MetA-pathway of phenol degradation